MVRQTKPSEEQEETAKPKKKGLEDLGSWSRKRKFEPKKEKPEWNSK